MCPLHADQELRKVDMSLLNRRNRRTIHLRKPKNPKVQEASLTRGHRNNGIVEVYDDDSDESDSEFYDLDDGGIVYKLPAHGIKLDFIDKVKRYVHAIPYTDAFTNEIFSQHPSPRASR